MQSTQQPTSRPSRRRLSVLLPLVSACALGAFGGLGGFTFGFGNGAAYLGNDPETCAQCHVMQEALDSWSRSSHREVAVCNDCHLPHDFAGKWLTKADNGFFHSLAFTTGDYPEPLRIKPRNRRVTQQACLHCHVDHVQALLPAEPGGDALLCVHCHADVGHALR